MQKVDVHSRFQTELRNLLRQLPTDVGSATWQPSLEQERIIYFYWQLVFDEWLICKKISPDFTDLWDNYYYNGVRGALKNPAFKKKIEKMLNGESGFLGQRTEFGAVLNQIAEKENGSPLNLTKPLV